TAVPTTTTVASTAGNGFEEFPLPTPNSIPDGIAVTPCNAFFTEFSTRRIGRLKTSAEEPIRNLRDGVDSLVDGGALNQGQGRSLNSKLIAALGAFNRNMMQPARN